MSWSRGRRLRRRSPAARSRRRHQLDAHGNHWRYLTVSGGYLNLTALGRGSKASATQTVTVNQIGTEHALRVVIERGPVTLRVGSTRAAMNTSTKPSCAQARTPWPSPRPGHPSTSSCSPNLEQLKRVDSITVEAAGVMTLPTIWLEADLWKMRFAQSADVVFVACDGYRPQRIERRSTRSWSVVRYQPDNGPFTIGTTRDVKLTPSVTEGNGTLTASAAFFNADHVGTLFSLFHEGFSCTTQLSGGGQYTDAFKVTGVSGGGYYNDRDWTYT
jgi:hypothetical protein